MKLIFISCLLVATAFHGFAQTCGNIKKIYAYYNTSMPGIQMTDENGNAVNPKPNITRFIYVEYSGTKMPDIKGVVYGGTELSFSVVSIKDKTVWIGDKKLNPNNSITAKKTNKLMKIDLQPADGKAMPDADCKAIIIKSKVGGKLCRFYGNGEKEFVTPPNY